MLWITLEIKQVSVDLHLSNDISLMTSCSLDYCCYCVLILITDHESLTLDNTSRSSPKVQNLATDFSLSPGYCLMEMKTDANRHTNLLTSKLLEEDV